MARKIDSELTEEQIVAKLVKYDAYPTAHQLAGELNAGSPG